MSNLKKGDIVKWNHTESGTFQRGIIVKPAGRPLGDKWFQVFTFHSGQIILKRMDRLIKVEERGT